jgi:hypothetical protein
LSEEQYDHRFLERSNDGFSKVVHQGIILLLYYIKGWFLGLLKQEKNVQLAMTSLATTIMCFSYSFLDF